MPDTDVIDGGRETSRCGNKDHSFSKHTWIKGGGARAEGGSSTTEDVTTQNIAQEGRQNNNCNNSNENLGALNVTGSRVQGRCGNKDASFSKHTWIKGGGARAEGGSSTTEDVTTQNIAQEGRQNNNCNNSNENLGALNVTGSRVQGRCGNKDASFSKHTWIKGGGARAEGGSASTDVAQRNTAQEGRQNNNCNSRNSDATLTVTGGRVEGRCGNKDFSFNHKTFTKGGGARAEGGSSTGAGINQQNTAQEGRQNNNCNNPNNLTLTTTSSRSQTKCVATDRSTNIGSDYR
ncbi:hypothetical protein [Streptomyces sp. NPDC051776]|uniref:hypothetical protein n=1 Tax=Streptomyces sp. NPDC051776 TaxID=3155414 RepID=UPI003441E791